MASLDELKDALRQTLEAKGVLGDIKARVRAEIFNALDDDATPVPHLSNENTLINELFREYLEYNKYRHTESVLVTETGMSSQPLERQFIADELHVIEDATSRQVPLLYGILALLRSSVAFARVPAATVIPSRHTQGDSSQTSPLPTSEDLSGSDMSPSPTAHRRSDISRDELSPLVFHH